MPHRYRIDAIRFFDDTFENEINRLLIWTGDSYSEAVDTLERLMREAGFKHIEQRLRHLKKKGAEKTFSHHASFVKNLHGYLGPAGYEMRKVKGDLL